MVLLVLAWLVLAPNLFVLRDSLVADQGFSLANYERFFESRAELRALWNSVWISLASVALSGLIGIPLAFFFARLDF
ncbi:MAG: iron ABC transporter permease, partial [Gemmatimonadota bacterium]